MTDQTVRYTGLAVTEKYLTVGFTVGETGAKRLYSVKVSMNVLASLDGFLGHLDRAVAKRLRDCWDLDEPMVLVPDEPEFPVPWS